MREFFTRVRSTVVRSILPIREITSSLGPVHFNFPPEVDSKTEAMLLKLRDAFREEDDVLRTRRPLQPGNDT
jgi:hypothetical protein